MDKPDWKKGGILILSASAGSGHLRAAEALREALSREAQAREAVHVDVLELAPRWVRVGYGDGFEFLAAHAPSVWKGLYRLTDGAHAGDSRWWTVAERLLFRRFRRLLASRDWSLCLCTHFLPCQLAAGDAWLPPFHLVATDFTLHRYWVQPVARRYFVPLESCAAELRGRTKAPVEVSGIPVGAAFGTAPSREEARRELGLDPRRPVLLVVAGGFGLRVEESVAAALKTDLRELQVLAVCGRNQEARARLAAGADPRLRILGFVDRMERVIAAADLVMTKPGGLTTSEALAVGRPLLLTSPIPGHEEGNARALAREGAAIYARGPREAGEALVRLFGTGDELHRLAAAARRLGRADAATAIARRALAAARRAAAA